MNESPIAGVSRELSRHIVNLLDSLSALFLLTELPVATLSETALLESALDALRQNQDMERCSIFLVTPDLELVNAAGFAWDDMLQDAATNTPRSPLQAHRRFHVGEGVMGTAAATGELQYCRSCAEDALFLAAAPGPRVAGALLSVPIRTENTVLGVLNIYHPQPEFFDYWHERLLLLFANTLGQLLSNCRLLHQREQMVERRTQELRHEIAERRAAEAQLATQHLFLQTVIDSVLDPIMVVGTDYRVQLMNRAAARLQSNMDTADSLCHQVAHGRAAPCSDQKHHCPLDLAQRQRTPVTLLHEHPNASGELRIVEVRASPLWNEDGTLRAIVESTRDVTERVLAEAELKEQHQALSYQAHHDHLTGLPNRMLFLARLRHAITRAQRHGRQLALLFVDLDGFKQINDTHGHAMGDAVLQTAAERLRHQVRGSDMVARLGGDEFTLLLEDVRAPDGLTQVARNLLAALTRPMVVSGHTFHIGGSIGISLYPGDGQDAEDLVHHADAAMYRAKARGKNTFQFYTADDA